MGIRRRAAGAAFAATLISAPAIACGPETDCQLGERTYRIALPEGPGPFGAILYMHGYRGTAAGAMRSEGLRAMADELNVALVAPKSGGPDWLLRHAPRKGFTDDRLELDYFDALLEDVVTRFPIDPERILATGFSAGGMMTWTLACHRSERFSAFAPIAGTFWAPIPDDCPNEPVTLVHINGTNDTVVPIEGRAIADTRQGNAREAFAVFALKGDYSAAGPVSLGADLGLFCEAAASGGERLLFCTHPGGHSIEPAWIAWAYRTFVTP